MTGRNESATPAPSPRLNTQPKGTTCEDCQRFRKEGCPYPESNITITRCNSFIIDLEQHDAAIAAQAREDALNDVLIKLSKLVSQISPEGSRLVWFPVIEEAIKELRRTKEQPCIARQAAAQAREDVMKKVCSQCPIKNEEMPLEDYSAESCEGCLIRKVVESLRTPKEQP